MSVVNTAIGVRNNRTLLGLNGFRFLYLTVLLLYGHAIGYRLLMYYKPGSGEYLTAVIGVILLATFSITFFRVLIGMKIAGGSSMLYLALYTLFGAFSIVNMYLYFGTIDIAQFATGFYKSILPVTLAFLAYSAVRNLNQAFKLFRAFALINGFLAMIGLITYLAGESWARFYLQLPQVEKLPLHFGGVLRMTSILWNPLVFGVLMALNCILAWNAIVNTKRARFFWIAIFLVSFVGTFASFTRTGWIMVVVGIATSLVLLRTRVLRRGLTIAVTMIGVLFVVLATPLPRGHYESMSEAILGHIVATFEHENPRVENLKLNLFRIAENPIGYGLGTAGYAALPTRGVESPVVLPDYIAADNNYLSMALQVGIPGLMFFVLSQIAALKRIVPHWKRATDVREKMILGTVVGWIVGMAVGTLFLNIWEYNLIPHLVFALLGASLKLRTLSVRSKQHAQLG